MVVEARAFGPYPGVEYTDDGPASEPGFDPSTGFYRWAQAQELVGVGGVEFVDSVGSYCDNVVEFLHGV